VLYE
jgi:hypothetical protein